MVTGPEDYSKTGDFLSNIVDITGQAGSGLQRDWFVNATTRHSKAQEYQDLLLGMKDDGDDAVLANGRMRRGGITGRGLYERLKERKDKQLMTDIILQQILDDLRELGEINAELAEIREGMMELAEKYLDEETLERREGETDEEYFARIDEELQKVRDSGEMDPADAQKFDDFIARQQELLRRKEEIEARLKEQNKQYDLVGLFDRQRQELIDERRNLTTQLEQNATFLRRLREIRPNDESGAGDLALLSLIQERPDLRFEFPEDASLEEKIEIVESTVAAETRELEADRVNVEDDLQEVEALQNTLTVAVRDEQLDNQAELSEERQTKEEFGLTHSYNFSSLGEGDLELPASDVASLDNDELEIPTTVIPGLNDTKFSAG